MASPTTKALLSAESQAVEPPSLAESGLVRPIAIGGGSLVRDYLAGKPEAARFFAGSPFELDSYRRKLDEVTRRFGPAERAAAARALRPTSSVAAARLKRFVEDGGAVVTTGQQAGFLTGPLYTIYKALTAVALARHLEAELGILVIPVFWVASDDHDWDEVNHAYLLDARNRLQRVALPMADVRPVPMSELPLPEGLEKIIAGIAQTIGAKSDGNEWFRTIVDPYLRPGATMAGAFADAMAGILAPFDACIADAADPALKAVAEPLLTRSLADAAAHESKLAERTGALEEAGYRGQVTVLERGTNLFYHGAGGRERLYRRGEGFAVRGRKESFSREELLVGVARNPARFSPNVFLRPVVESWVYPTLAYVGGPGELAYFAQVNALFDEVGILPPVAVPRFSALVVEPKLERLLGKLELSIVDTQEPRDQLVERMARREVPGEVRSALNELRVETSGAYARLMERVVEIDSTLVRAAGGSRNRALAEAARMERKILRAIKRGDRIATDQLDRLLDSLRPNAAPQDRVLNVLPFLVRYGDHFLREVERAIREGWRLPT